MLIIVFFAGILVGLSTGMILAPGMFMRHLVKARGGDVSVALTRDLNLRPDQDQQVRSIIARHTANVRATMGEARTKLDEEVRQLDSEVTPLLDATQQAQWRENTSRVRLFRSHSPQGRKRGDARHHSDSQEPQAQ